MGRVRSDDIPVDVLAPGPVRILHAHQPVGRPPRRLQRLHVARGPMPRDETVHDLRRIEDRGTGPVLVHLPTRERA
jgi:hypothetical protein